MRPQVLQELKQIVDKLLRQSPPSDASPLARITEQISRAFEVQPDEVAILTLTPDRRFLRFLFPDKLKPVGQIPLTSTTSLAARTAREKRPEIINHFSIVPHASVFEAVPLGEERGEPIQKIMSAPMTLEKKVVGVIQVSRKARNAASAGRDFSAPELRELRAIADLLAPCIALFPLD